MERRKMNRKEIGEAGESRACEVLCRQGYRILCRNYRCPYGEIDIIAGKGGKLIFAEVKTRLSDGWGAAEILEGVRNAAGFEGLQGIFSRIRRGIMTAWIFRL